MNKENTSKILSIIVPTFNLKEKLCELIESFNYNNHDLSDVEILIINDGSKDNTLEFAEKCKDKYPSFITIINKENGGHGSVINAGIKIAKGKYFKVIDGDDLVEHNNFEQLVSFLRKTNVDLVLSPYCKLYIEDNSKELCEVVKGNLEFEKNYEFADVLTKINTFGLHAITIKTSVLQDNKISVDEKVFYDDTQYSIYPVPYIKTVAFTRNYIYIYRLGFEEQSMNITNRWKRKNQLENVVMNIVRFYQKTPANSTKKYYIEDFVSECVLCVYDLYLGMGTTLEDKMQLIQFDKNLKSLSPEIYKNTYNKKTYLMRKSGFNLFSFLSGLYRFNNKLF